MEEQHEVKKAQRSDRAGDDDDKNALEWTVFAISLVLVLAILAYLGYMAYTSKPSTPDLTVEYFHDPAPHAPQRYRVVVENKGGETAEEVQVELTLQRDGEEVEQAELSIAFSPKESKREGWVIFRENIRQTDSLAARVVSYKRP
ncbi:hypothetical protein [Pontibacter ramchanderi]|uniref:Uncharacterized protein (TIGR02588 family) n=1 Tax=Pontibacter ramchanderi TaxID=1179743 RepID=A0A2N3U802_9BACT|nr:hypothetical protein [Pontibacter ramchanderi]PKV62845.1 uncharacterized protein (TIGR02588 family) [Pontibacter ramchanderi]